MGKLRRTLGCERVLPKWLAGLLLIACAWSGRAAEPESEAWRYFGQRPPGLEPVVFAPGLVSKTDVHEFGSVFSKDGRTFFLGVDLGDCSEVQGARLVGGTWSASSRSLRTLPMATTIHSCRPTKNACISFPTKPLGGTGPKKDHDIWYAERQGDGWSAPINAGRAINSPKQDYYISFTDTGTMYFASNVASEDGRDRDFDLYSARAINGAFETRERLPETINSRWYEADVFVAPDASFLVFVSVRRAGPGNGELYVSISQC